MGPPRRPLLQQASKSMQVSCEDRDTHGAFEAFPAMHAHPVQAMTFQRMDRRFHARIPPASRHERCFTFPGSRLASVPRPFAGNATCSSTAASCCWLAGLWNPRSKLHPRNSGYCAWHAATSGTATSTSPPCHCKCQPRMNTDVDLPAPSGEPPAPPDGLALHDPARMRLEQREQFLLVRDHFPFQHATADLILQTHQAGVKPAPSRQLRRATPSPPAILPAPAPPACRPDTPSDRHTGSTTPPPPSGALTPQPCAAHPLIALPNLAPPVPPLPPSRHLLSARSSGVGNGSVRVGPMNGDPENRSESGSEEGEHRHRQLANEIKNQRITKAQDRILNRMAKSTKRMPLLVREGHAMRWRESPLVPSWTRSG